MAINLTKQAFSSIELFAGAGGLALGLEQAGFHAVLLNEQDKHACATLQNNRPHWPILMQDIAQVDFSPYSGQVDLLSGGFPCQAFSYAGQGKGFLDTRGTLFFQFARAIQEVQPKVILGENVKGLLRHDAGKTLATIYHTLQDLGYCLLAPKVLNAVNYRVAQKRERLFILGLRRDLAQSLGYDLDFDAFAQSFESFGDAFAWPRPYHRPMVLADALKKGPLYATDVPASPGQSYAEAKKAVLDLVPAGGCWRDLPDEVARDYMKKSYFLGGGKTGMARRLAWHEPSLTLTTSPAQNQTERCHPDATRPLTVREYARIQSFPDEWAFAGSINQQYKQIGNAVPVNLAKAVGCAVARLLKYLANELSH